MTRMSSLPPVRGGERGESRMARALLNGGLDMAGWGRWSRRVSGGALLVGALSACGEPDPDIYVQNQQYGLVDSFGGGLIVVRQAATLQSHEGTLPETLGLELEIRALGFESLDGPTLGLEGPHAYWASIYPTRGGLLLQQSYEPSRFLARDPFRVVPSAPLPMTALIAISPSGRFVSARTQDALTLLDTDDVELAIPPVSAPYPSHVAWAHETDTLFAVHVDSESHQATIRSWDVPALAAAGYPTGTPDFWAGGTSSTVDLVTDNWLEDIVVSPHDDALALAVLHGPAPAALLYSVSTGEAKLVDGIRAPLAFSPDGARLVGLAAAVEEERHPSIATVDVTTAMLTKVPTQLFEAPRFIARGDGYAVLLPGNEDPALRIDLETGDMLALPEHHVVASIATFGRIAWEVTRDQDFRHEELYKVDTISGVETRVGDVEEAGQHLVPIPMRGEMAVIGAHSVRVFDAVTGELLREGARAP